MKLLDIRIFKFIIFYKNMQIFFKKKAFLQHLLIIMKLNKIFYVFIKSSGACETHSLQFYWLK